MLQNKKNCSRKLSKNVISKQQEEPWDEGCAFNLVPRAIFKK